MSFVKDKQSALAIGVPKTLAKLLDDPRVDEISDESGYGDGYWIYLEPGWWSPGVECHFVHEWNVKDVMREFKAIVPCQCDQCKGEES